MKITAVKTLPPTSLLLRWADGYEAILDLDPYLPASDPLRDPLLFIRARVQGGHAIAWPGGIEHCSASLRDRTSSMMRRSRTAFPLT